MPLLWLSSAFLAGIVCAACLPLPWWLWAGLVLGALALFAAEIRWPGQRWENRWRKIALLALGLLLAGFFGGGLRYQLTHLPAAPKDLAYYNDQGKVELVGQISADPDRRERSLMLRVRVQSIRFADGHSQPVRGEALLRLPAGGDWRYGEQIEIWGQPLTPPENEAFSYRAYLSRQGIRTLIEYPAIQKTGLQSGNPLLRAAFWLRERAYQAINRLFPQPEAALLSGILLGLDKDLPTDLERAFQDTGTAHIIAISGFNMAILSGLFIQLFGRVLPRAWAALAAVLAILFYTLLVGANPAVVRAAVMSGLAVFGHLIGRSAAGLNPLAFSAAVMCLFNPDLPWDVSFQLSFTATLGLVLYAGPLQSALTRWLEKKLTAPAARKIAAPVSEYFLFTLAAQVTTLPVILYHFERLSGSTLLANPLVLPVQPAVMILSGLAAIAGMLLPPLGQFLGWLAWPFAAYTLRVVELLSRLPRGVFTVGQVSLGAVAAFYALLFFLTGSQKRLAGLRKQLRPELGLAGLGLLAVLAWTLVLHRPDGRLHLSLFNLPDSQAVLIQTPNGSRILIDGAPSANALGGVLGRRSTPLDRRLDALLVSTSRSAALEGLPLLAERFPVGQVLWAIAPPDKRAAARLQDLLLEQDIPQAVLSPGQQIQLDEGVVVTVLAANADSAALLLEWQNLHLLFPGQFSPQQLTNLPPLDGVILNAADLSPDSEWNSTPVRPAVRNGQSAAALPEGWLSPGRAWLELHSDGTQLWIESR